MPLTVIRVVTDQFQNDLSKILTKDHMNRLAERVKGTMSKDIIRYARKQITELIKSAEDIASKEKEDIIENKIKNMIENQNLELDRLIALSKVNPNIRQEEIDYLKSTVTELERHIKQVQLKLDSIRVAIIRK